MRGAVFLGNRKVELRTFPDPAPGPGEVVIEMKASGMCGSDLKFYRSPPGAAQAALGRSLPPYMNVATVFPTWIGAETVLPVSATFAQAGLGGAMITVRFAIKGEITEEWYCPRLDVAWPDGTNTMREADCDPWPDHVHTGYAWSFKRGFPPGEYAVRGCISKADKTLACTDALVRVVG